MIDNAAYTPEMLAYWQKKWVNGGHFSTGNQAIPNAPDQRLGMMTGMKAFMAKPGASLWRVPGTGVLKQSNTAAVNPVEGKGWPLGLPFVNLLLAAQYGLVAKDGAVSNAAAAALMRQVREPSTNWKRSAGPYGEFGDESKKSDNGRFAHTDFVSDGPACLWFYSEWFIRLCHTYWFVKHVLTASEQQEVKDWAKDFGYFNMLERRALDSKWSNRKAAFDADVPQLAEYGAYKGATSQALKAMNTAAGFDGQAEKRYAWDSNNWINNRRNKMQCAAAHAGIVAGDKTLIKYGKVTWEELLAFFIGSEGTIAEHNRATKSWASKGLNYAISSIFTYVPIADYLARLYNDQSMYKQVSVLGHGCTEYPKPNITKARATATDKGKDMAFVIASYGKYLTGEFQFKSKDGLPINGRSGNGKTFQQSDVCGEAIAWNFYSRTGHPLAGRIHQLCLRTAPGIYGYKTGGAIQSQGSLIGATALNADLASSLWLYEDLADNKVISYPFETVTPPPPVPTGPAVVAFWLVNADTGQDVVMLGPNNIIPLPAYKANIRAKIGDVPVDNVIFSLSGQESVGRIEGAAPYTLFGDSDGKYNGHQFAPGTYSLKATPNVGDKAGQALTINFTIK